MREVVDEIVRSLTSQELKGKLVVILAGYERAMEEMLKTNQGLRSRFSEKLPFDDFTPEVAGKLLLANLSQREILLADDAVDELEGICAELASAPDWSNGRDIENWTKRIYREVALSFQAGGQGETELVASLDILRRTANSLILSKKDQSGEQGNGDGGILKRMLPRPPTSFATASEFTSMHTLDRKIEIKNAEPNVEEEEVKTPKTRVNEDSGMSTGMSKTELKALQAVLDDLGLNSEDGMRGIGDEDPNGPRMSQLARALAGSLRIDVAKAREMLVGWQMAQKNVQKEMKKAREKMAKKGKQVVPIWRCRVCGRADLPYIACYVDPYIARYEEQEF